MAVVPRDDDDDDDEHNDEGDFLLPGNCISILAWFILSKFINIRAVVFQKNYVLNNILF